MQAAGLVVLTQGPCSSPASNNLNNPVMHCRNSACLLYHLPASRRGSKLINNTISHVNARPSIVLPDAVARS